MTNNLVLLLYLLLPWCFSIVSTTFAASALNNEAKNEWFQSGVDLIKDNLRLRENRQTAKNVIMFLGDGMGPTTVTSARILEGQLRGETGEENALSWEKFPWSAFSKTYNTDQQVADSAGTATAYLNGVKTRAGVIAVDETVRKGYCADMTEATKVKSILTLAEEAGMSTGIVTTTRITHASPSVLYSYSPDRNWENDMKMKSKAKDDSSSCKDIALQLAEYSVGDGIEVLFGGGRQNFYPKNQSDPEYPQLQGKRGDGRNLVNEWLANNPDSQFLWNKTAFDALDVKTVKHVMGLFEYSHMQYEVERVNDTGGEPSIAEMTAKAIEILSKNPKGFFLFVEGGRIDHGHHGGKAVKALMDTVAMAKAVDKAVSIVGEEETLMITTADHSHVLSIAGYPRRGNPIFELVVEKDNATSVGKDGLPYTTLGYANGPGGLSLNESRQNLTGVNTADKDFLQQALVKTSSESHAGEDVGIYATGPGAYLFHGVVEQHYIFHVMDHALCLTSSKQDKCFKHGMRGGEVVTRGPPRSGSAPLIPLAMLIIFVSFVVAMF
ncbi:alkaline phosphatase-like [Actinia tenebrosa]|uniref:Alkaline phosphatase n=1 Tax=Actinia tenebrosa TaxID=6105 RepID=A0A6P8H1Y7_ACTTE|nr:alkaline phosphatase-like [Actinia tenebrosa]